MRTFIPWLVAAGILPCVTLVSCKKDPGEGQRQNLEDAGYSMTPEDFLRAAEGDDLKALESMMSGGIAAGVTDAKGRSALHAAAAAGSVKAATLLLDRGVPIDLTDQSGRTPLMEAVMHADPEMVKFLLRQGGDPSLKDSDRYKPLMLAVKAGRADMVAELAPYVRQDLDDALLAASILGEAQVIDELTNYGASIYARLEDGRTPLMLAAQHGRAEAVEMLLDIGANRFTMDSHGKTAAELAKEAGHEDLAARLAAEPGEGDFVLEEADALAEEMVAEVETGREEVSDEEGDASLADNENGADPPVDANDAPTGEAPEIAGGGLPSADPEAEQGGEETGSGVVIEPVDPGAEPGRPAVAAPRRERISELEGVVVGGGPARTPAEEAGRNDVAEPSTGGSTTQAATDPAPVVMRAYRENELPLRVDSTTEESAMIQVVGGAKQEVAVGSTIPGSTLKVIRISRKMQSGKENQGEPVEVSVVTLSDGRSGVERDLVVGLPALAHDPVALVEDASTGKYYVARTGQRFRTADGDDYLVGDVRPNQIVLEDVKTGETRTIPLSGPRG
ncbi:MAG: ankyrin repeat domain-containing protein [Akkermansiaceae bacterium]|nr:ankyrin repeat domain-containing protein [Akkermansiaceae bacterium]